MLIKFSTISKPSSVDNWDNQNPQPCDWYTRPYIQINTNSAVIMKHVIISVAVYGQGFVF